MSVRFRIRTSAGQELSFATHEMFENFVRSGDLAPDDLVYDVETAEWSPARTVPLVLEIEYEREAAEEAAANAEAGGAGSGSGATPVETSPAAGGPTDGAGDGDTSLGLSLAPEQERSPETHDAGAGVDDPLDSDGEGGDLGEMGMGLELAPAQEVSPDDAAKAFVDRMESERSDPRDGPERASSMGGFHMEDPTTLAMLSRTADPPEEAPRRDEPQKARIARPNAPPKKGAGRRVASVVIGLGLVGGAAWGAMQLFGAGTPQVGPAPEDSVVPVATTPPPPPPRQPIIGTTEAAVRERAHELVLTRTQALLRDLQPVPDAWTTGAYLASPSSHPEVLAVWTEYLTTIRQVRTGDAARIEAAYEQALDDAVIEGEGRSEWFTRGMAGMTARDSLRSAHFDRVEALASAAIQSHNALLEAEGLIIYDATGSTGVRTGIGAGTSGRDTDAQLLLDQVLDLLSSTLDAEGLGPREGANVREWVYDGYLNAVTN